MLNLTKWCKPMCKSFSRCQENDPEIPVNQSVTKCNRLSCTEKTFSWIETKERIPDVLAGKYRVRVKNGNEMDAYFYQDSMAWIAFFGQKTSHWWSAHGDNERLDGVTHWRECAHKRG